jgi:hypothetical protein
MSAQNCIDAVRKATGEDFSDEKVAEIFELLDRRAARKMKDDPAIPRETALRQATEDLIAEKKLAALIEKRSRAINAVRRQALIDFVKTSGLTPSKALEAKIYGVEGKLYGAGGSTDAKAHALRHSLRGALLNDLEKAGMVEVARKSNPDFELAVAREMAFLNGAKGVKQSKDTNVRTLAQIFVKHGENGRLIQNDAGAWIRKLEGYVSRQSHNQLSISKAGADKWVNDILPLLDERTFDDVPAGMDRKQWLNEMYVRLASGQHIKVGGGSDFMGGFKGPSNLAKKASAERVLHFKGPDEWMKYNHAYGRRSLYESVLDAVDYAARNTAVMRDWGTNPEAMFEGLRERYIKKAEKSGDVKTAKDLGNWKLTAGFNQLTNAVDVPGSVRLAQIGSMVRLVQSMSKLGGVVLSSFPDIGVRAAVLKHNGVGFLESYAKALTPFFEGKGSAEKREIANSLGVGLDGMLGDVFHQLHSMDSAPGRMTKIANTFFKFSFMNWWQDSVSRGVGMMLSNNLAENLSKPFAQLDRRLQVTLARYGIGEKELAALAHMETKAADGRRYATGDGVLSLTDDHLRAYLGPDASPKAIAAARRDLGDKVSMYVADQVREALTVAGAKERAMTTFGKPAGTPHGEAIRMLMQFKTYPITYISRSLNREFSRGDAFTIGHLLAATTGLGYLSLTVKDFIKGREPRSPEDAGDYTKLLFAAMKQGGGFGIYGDFLFGEANRFGGGWASTLAGPTIGGTVGDVERVVNAVKSGKDPSATAFRGVLNNTPFANLFYTRVAADYLFLYAIQDQLNPGFLRRYERQVEKDNNQRFLYPPSDYDKAFSQFR